MEEWKKDGPDKFTLIPNGESRFTLIVEKKGNGFVASVDDDAVDDGTVFKTLKEAQDAARMAYDDYWADFEYPE